MRENKVIVKATRLVLAHNHTPLLSQSHMFFVTARWLKVSQPTPRSDSLRVTNLHQPNVPSAHNTGAAYSHSHQKIKRIGKIRQNPRFQI